MAAPLRFKTDIADYAGNAWVSYKIYIRLIPKTKDYAQTAVNQQNENLKNNDCRFRGNRWSTDFHGHYQWTLQ
jgi:hypothetical protein